MHEFSIIEQLVTELKTHLAQDNIDHVTEIHFRRGSTFSEDALRMAFESFSIGTPLEGATVVIETIPIAFQCECGHTQLITADDLQGHMMVCPACGAVREIDEAHDLTVTKLVTTAPMLNPTVL